MHDIDVGMLKPNLVLGLAYGYSEQDLAPFILSFCKNTNDVRLHIFGDEGVTTMLAALNDPRIACTDASAFRETCRSLGVRPELGRYFLYRDFLRKSGLWFGGVLLCDVRDVIFQTDVFTSLKIEDKLFVAVEDRSIGACDLNQSWIRTAYGTEVAEAMSRYPILCSGTTFGSVNAISIYLDAMCHEIKSKSIVLLEQLLGLDQGIHNYLVRNKDLGPIAIPENHEYISTQHYTSAERLSWADNAAVVDRCKRPAIVHQYDRHPSIKAQIDRRYRF